MPWPLLHMLTSDGGAPAPRASCGSHDSLDARVEHLDELLLLEGARDLGPEPLDEVRAITFELRADDAARPRHVDGHAVQHAAGARREHDHTIRQIDGLVDVVGDEDDRLARAAP